MFLLSVRLSGKNNVDVNCLYDGIFYSVGCTVDGSAPGEPLLLPRGARRGWARQARSLPLHTPWLRAVSPVSAGLVRCGHLPKLQAAALPTAPRGHGTWQGLSCQLLPRRWSRPVSRQCFGELNLLVTFKCYARPKSVCVLPLIVDLTTRVFMARVPCVKKHCVGENPVCALPRRLHG